MTELAVDWHAASGIFPRLKCNGTSHYLPLLYRVKHLHVTAAALREATGRVVQSDSVGHVSMSGLP